MVKDLFDLLIEKESRILTSKLKKAEEFEIFISIRPSYNEESFQDFSDMAPPMPFIIGPFACYDKGPQMTIQVKEDLDKNYLVNFENNLEVIDINFSYKKNQFCRIKINDAEVFDHKLHSLNFGTKISIGKGYKNRTWKGQVNNITIAVEGEDEISINDPNSPD